MKTIAALLFTVAVMLTMGIGVSQALTTTLERPWCYESCPSPTGCQQNKLGECKVLCNGNVQIWDCYRWCTETCPPPDPPDKRF